MNKTLRRRIDRLHVDVVIDCDTCRSWCGTVLRDDDGESSRPESCPDCGRVVPIYRELHIVGIPLDVP